MNQSIRTFNRIKIVLTATFTAPPIGGAAMTGTINFYDGTTFLGSAPLGAPRLSTSTLAVGSHSITAVYSGVANYSAATTATPVAIQVVRTLTSTTLAATTTPQVTTLNAKVAVTSAGNPTIAGSVAFYDGATLVGTSPLSSGVATLNLGTLSAGAHQFVAVYSGGLTSAPSQATPLTVNPTVTGKVYLDLNANGKADAGEPGMAGRVVFLDLHHDGTLDAGDPTATTDANGNFTLSGSTAGAVVVVEATSQDAFDQDVVDQTQVNSDGTVSLGVVPISPVVPVLVVPSPYSMTPGANADAAYIQSLYHAVLGRVGSTQEVQSWTTIMSQSRLPRQTVAANFVNSSEPRRDEVNSFYQEFLHRSPDSSSAYYVNLLMSGVTEETIAEMILDSPEFQAAHKDPSLLNHDLYIDVLGRQGSQAEITAWKSILATSNNPAAVVAGFVESHEANDRIVESFYSAFLHRQPKAGVRDAWTTQLGSPNGSASNAMIRFLTSPEYQRNATTPRS